MTAAQKKNRERFIKVQAEAKKLKKKNPKLKHIEAIKKAWAILLHDTKASKKVKAIKIIKKHKKVSGVKKHTDTKSHNISVRVSGVRNTDLLESLKHTTNQLKHWEIVLEKVLREKQGSPAHLKRVINTDIKRIKAVIKDVKKNISNIKKHIK